MEEMVYDIHTVPGRLRVKIPTMRSNPHADEEMASLFSGHKGIKNIAANPITGSVVINYDPTILDSGRILKALRREGYLTRFTLKTAEEGRQPSLPRTREALGRALFGWAVGNLLENTGLSFLAVLI
ncbi:MAG: HMA2 domain-containing protein [Thermodesulfobacteriota bacterium]